MPEVYLKYTASVKNKNNEEINSSTYITCNSSS